MLGPAQARAIKAVGVLLGGGLQDPIHTYAIQDLGTLQKVGDKPFVDFINGGHDWYVWRILLRDFLAQVRVQICHFRNVAVTIARADTVSAPTANSDLMRSGASHH